MARYISNPSSLLDIRKNFIAASGRVDLVVDTIDYSDNGADYFIQRAVDFLDFSYPHEKSIQRYQFDIVSGEYFHRIPKLIGIRDQGEDHEGGVWLSSSDSMIRLKQANVGWMRDNISRPVSSLDTNTPKYYALVHHHLAESQLGLRKYEAATEEFDFSNSDGWTLVSSWSIANGKMTAGGSVAGDAQYSTGITANKSYLLEVEVGDRTAGTVTISFGTESVEISANGPHRFEITPTDNLMEVDCTAAFDGSLDNISLKEISNSYQYKFTYDFEDVHYPTGTDTASMFKDAGLLFMSPADGRYTITVFGWFRSKLLSSDTDVNYWSSVHPDALLQAAMFQLELTHRNTQGQQDALNGLTAIMNPVLNAKALSNTNYRWLD